MKRIEVVGERTAARKAPATLDISARASLCLRHMLQNTDPKFGHVPFVGVTLGEARPHFVHHRLDWTEVLPYSVYGMVIARDICGDDAGLDIQAAQRKLYLGFFNELDGLIHAPASPWNPAYPMCLWEQARALYALLYWFLDDGDERLLVRIHAVVDGLFGLSHQEGRQRLFPPALIRAVGMGPYGHGALIDPLVKVYELTGSTRALQMAEGIAHQLLRPANGFFDETGRFSSWFRTVMSVINGLSRYAALVEDPRVVERAKSIHDYAASLCTSFGSTPCTEPACSDMELTQSALSLVRLGFHEYWDMIDRFARNQTAEAQFLDPSEWVSAKAARGRILDKETWVYEGYPADLATLPYDDYTDVVKRSAGGFLWTCADEHQFVPASLMLCCSAHALRTFHLLWQQTLVEDIDGLRVNLHYTVENRLGSVTSWEPHQGKTVVVPRCEARLRVRIPEHAMAVPVRGSVGGVARSLPLIGRYADFGPVPAGAECVLEFPLTPRETEERQVVFDGKESSKIATVLPFRARWRGNTVIELTPRSTAEKRIYKRADLDRTEAVQKNLCCFISGKDIRW
ncbi:MAG: hypothetical protein A2177_12460 [Spirochaetes bacterium RBG_13_68_11]|nr:MAG: hypothetical protein A2177_12460 [Spirochaetes bacterium RBG_13_68_11]